MLSAAIDVFRLRQYFDVATRARQLAEGVAEDPLFLHVVRRGLVPLPFDRYPHVGPVFPRSHARPRNDLPPRIALAATGGSGALASIVGVARGLEDAGRRFSVISVCSGSALFGFPLGAGRSPDEVAGFVATLRPADYLDPAWRRIAGSLALHAGRRFAGMLAGERIEATYRRWLGDIRLGDLPIPTYAPIWNVEENRLEYLGPATHPDMPVARAVRHAIAPLFVDPVPLDGGWWCDGGLVDIFPVKPLLDLEPASDLVVAVNGFYPPEFAGEREDGWYDRPASILRAASQVRTCQQIELARLNLARLREAVEVLMLEPVPYDVVRGVGFYRQFVSNADWPDFMRAGRVAMTNALATRTRHPAPVS
jgi:NTE family protein